MALHRRKLFGILLVGDSGVGKTSLLFRVTENVFPATLYPVISVVKNSKNNNQQDKRILETLRHTIITAIQTYRAVVFIFDLSQRDSFENLSKWIPTAIKNALPGTIFALFGNKNDMKRNVTEKEAEALANSYQMTYYEVSAATGANVLDSMCKLFEISQLEQNLNNPVWGVPKCDSQTIITRTRLRNSRNAPREASMLEAQEFEEESESCSSSTSDSSMRFLSREESSVADVTMLLTKTAARPIIQTQQSCRFQKQSSVSSVINSSKKRSSAITRLRKSKSTPDPEIMSMENEEKKRFRQYLLELFNSDTTKPLECEQVLRAVDSVLKHSKFGDVRDATTKDSVLHIAVRNKLPFVREIVLHVIKKYENHDFLDLVNLSGNTVLHVAVVRNNISAVDVLLKARPQLLRVKNNAKQTILHLAAIYGRSDILKKILNFAKTSNISLPIQSRDQTHSTVHQLAAMHKNRKIISLLPPEINPESVNKFGFKTTSLLNSSSTAQAAEAQFLQKAQESDFSEFCEFMNNNGHLYTMKFPNSYGGGILHSLFQCHELGASKKHFLRFLLEHGADCNVQDNNGNLPLHLAVAQPYVELVELLVLEYETKLEICNSDNNTVFHIAMYAGYTKVIQLLCTKVKFDVQILEQLNKNHLSSFHIACNGNHETVEFLLKLNPSLAKQVTQTLETPLHIAARNNDTKIANLLITSNPAMLHKIDMLGRNPLLSATNFFAIEIVMFFLEYNAKAKQKIDLKIKGDNGYTAFQSLVSVANVELHREELYFKVLDELLQQGANIDETTKNMEMSPLNLAVINNSTKIALYLLNNGASVSLGNFFHDTPLHYASENLNLDLVRALLQLRADVNALNLSQLSPLLLCSQFAYDDNALPVAKQLLKYGSKIVDLCNIEKKNVLHYAIEYEASARFIRLLLKRCPPNLLNELINGETIHGDTPLSISIANEALDIAETLNEFSITPCSRLKTPLEYKRIEHKYLTGGQQAAEEKKEIFVPVLEENQTIPSNIRVLRFGSKDNAPQFPEQYWQRNSARISVLLGSSPYLVPFIGIKLPATLLYSTENEKGLGTTKFTLNDFLRSQRSIPMNPANSIHLAQHITSALLYVHQYLPSKPSIIHNWINRFSVLLTDTNCVQLTNFQHSKFQESTEYTALPFSPYTAPEVIQYGICSEKSDVFSFGILLWEILSSSNAWEGISVCEIENFVLSGGRPDLTKLNEHKWIRDNLVEVIKECWDEDEEKRPTFQKLFRFFSAYNEKRIGDTPRGSQPPGNVLKHLTGIDGHLTTVMEYPKDFLPQISERRAINSFKGGASALFEFAEVDKNPCVLKGLPLSDDYLERVFVAIKETEMLRMFRACPQIVRYHFHTVCNNRCTIYMDRYNMSVKDDIRRRKAEPSAHNFYSFSECHAICMQVALAIQFIHDYDKEDPIVHRDIKTNNVFMGYKNDYHRVALGDFGITCHVSEINPDIQVGTYGLRAPEIEEKKPYGTESDIYSFGMMLFELITLSPEIVDSVQMLDKYERWSELLLLAKRCVYRNPANRPTADIVVDTLNRITKPKKKKIPIQRNRSGTSLT